MTDSISTISRYIYGTTRLGDENISRDARLDIARRAVQSGVWFHTSRMYGEALEVLGQVFAEDPDRTPKLVIKIGWDQLAQLRQTIQENVQPMGVAGVQLGQLCLQGDLAEDFARGGECYREFQALKDEGLVQGLVVEAFPWTSDPSLRAIRGGYTKGIIDGFIFYLNPLQRFASNELWDEIQQRQIPIVAMRTVSGGPVHRLRDEPGFAWKDYLRQRAGEVAPIFERSGIGSWTEFCVRFAHSVPGVVATVGSTARVANLEEFLNAAENHQNLDAQIVQEILALQRQWSAQVDVHAEPWSM